ncbi:MAG: response regulator [Candidatus Gastranaerophilales bacterium]|nr:response regulator [Candidatus Gastranaerophilales bacterium]
MDILAKILVIDDEIMVTKTLKTLLKLEGYSNVFAFNTPKEALEWLELNDCSVIISDFIMPDMNGIEFLLKAKELNPDTTQILLTGYADKENAIRAINEVGIFKYIEKPWNNDDIILNIKNGIERTELKIQLKNKIEELELLNKNLENIVDTRTKELKTANNKLETIIKNLSEGLVVLNSNNLIEQANNAAKEILKIKNESLENKNFFELVINEKNRKTSLKTNETLYLKDFSVVDYMKNTTCPIELSLSKILLNGQNKTIVLLHDVTTQKENERLKDDFIATLTHDLRTPVLASINALDFALNGTLGGLNNEQYELFSTMKKSTEDMLGLVNVLLEVYRYESNKMHLVKTDFEVKELIEECIKELKPLSLGLDIQIKGDKTLINADRSEIKRVLFNILGNAIKHSFEGGKIEVGIFVQNKDVSISVKDYGEGLSKEDLDNLFKKFSTGSGKKRVPSTGLGLYLSRQIVEAHNGKIYAEGSPNEGALFTFTLNGALKKEGIALI